MPTRRTNAGKVKVRFISATMGYEIGDIVEAKKGGEGRYQVPCRCGDDCTLRMLVDNNAGEQIVREVKHPILPIWL